MTQGWWRQRSYETWLEERKLMALKAQTKACRRRLQAERRLSRRFPPAIIFHHAAAGRVDLFFLERKAFALVPAPSLLVLAHAAQPDFVRKLQPAKGEQPSPKAVALIFRRHEQLVEIAISHRDRQHRCKPPAVIGDIKAPASLDLHPYSRPQLLQQGIAGVFDPDRCPAVHPDAGDLVIFLRSGG